MENGNMSDSRLHKEKGKSKRGEYGEDFNDYPEKVQKYYDRRCGTIDGRKWKNRKLEKERKHEDDLIKQEF